MKHLLLKGHKMRNALSILIIISNTASLNIAREIPLDQELIVACHKLQVERVVRCLRDGANINGRFGENSGPTDYFVDRWTGESPLATDSWTPLIALASSLQYPDPPPELGEISGDRA